MVDEVDVTDGQSRVFLRPPKAYPDGHGFHHDVDLVGGSFHGTINASSYESPRALGSFHKQLVALYENLRGEAYLPNSYDNLRMTLKGDGRGHITVWVEARIVVQVRGTVSECLLSFGFAIDQTHLPTVTATVGRWVTEHPALDP